MEWLLGSMIPFSFSRPLAEDSAIYTVNSEKKETTGVFQIIYSTDIGLFQTFFPSLLNFCSFNRIFQRVKILKTKSTVWLLYSTK